MNHITENWFYKRGYLIGQIESSNNWQPNNETNEYRAQVRERIIDLATFERVEQMQNLSAGMKAGRRAVIA